MKYFLSLWRIIIFLQIEYKIVFEKKAFLLIQASSEEIKGFYSLFLFCFALYDCFMNCVFRTYHESVELIKISLINQN